MTRGRLMFRVEVLIPTARFVFTVDGCSVNVVPEHRSPEAFERYTRLRDEHAVTGMLTFPNSVAVWGTPSFLVDPGLHLQNVPVLRALEQRGVQPGDVAFAALTHAHGDHAGALADLRLPVVVHEGEMQGAGWRSMEGLFAERELTVLAGDEGELVPGVRWLHTPGHTAGSVSYAVDTPDGVVVLCGDTIGPLRRPFDEMTPSGPAAGDLLTSWERIRALEPALIVAGHLPPFAPQSQRQEGVVH